MLSVLYLELIFTSFIFLLHLIVSEEPAQPYK